MSRVELIRRQIQSGTYRDYMDRSPDVLDAVVSAAAEDVLREEMRRGGEDIPPVVTGQGSYLRSWPDDGEHPGPLVPGMCDRQRERRESSCLGTAIVAVVFIGLSFWAMVARLCGWM